MLYYLVHLSTIVFCSLLVSTPPTLDTWRTNCPAFNFGWGAMPSYPGLADVDTYLLIRAVDTETGQTFCEVPAFLHLGGMPCPGLWPPDHYFLQLIWKDAPFVVCRVATPDLSACPDAPTSDRVEWRGPFPVPAPPPPPEAAVEPPRPNFPETDALATAWQSDYLDYQLRWYGLSDSVTWQNQWDEAILGAGQVANVPPDLLKAVLWQETNLWPMWTGDAGEVGLIQLTWTGADTALRHSPELYARYCQRGIWPGYCGRPYDLLANWMRGNVAAALIADLTLSGMPWERAEQIGDDLVTYARILAAFYTYAAALGYSGWDFALAAYNAGGKCIATGIICPEGQAYMEKVMKGR